MQALREEGMGGGRGTSWRGSGRKPCPSEVKRSSMVVYGQCAKKFVDRGSAELQFVFRNEVEVSGKRINAPVTILAQGGHAPSSKKVLGFLGVFLVLVGPGVNPWRLVGLILIPFRLPPYRDLGV